MESSSQRFPELKIQLDTINTTISERVKAVASSKALVQVMKEELKIKDLAIRQLAEYFVAVYSFTHPDALNRPPLIPKEKRGRLIVEDLHKKPHPILEEQIAADLRDELSHITAAQLRDELFRSPEEQQRKDLSPEEQQRSLVEYQTCQRKEHCCRGAIDDEVKVTIAQPEAEIDLSVQKVAYLHNVLVSAQADSNQLAAEIERRDLLLDELEEALDKLHEIEENVQAELAEMGPPYSTKTIRFFASDK